MRYRNLPHSLDVILRRLHILLGKRNILSAIWWGVILGQNSRFSGKCYFKRYPGSLIKIGANCEFLSRVNSNLIGINRPCSISTLTQEAIVEIGDNCGFSGTVIGSFKSICLGKNVKCGANTLITDSDWHPEDLRSGKPRQVVIEDNVWLGTNVVILKGVTIGKNTVIGANSVITKSIPADVIAAGNPCKVIREINKNNK
jgi:acetyltransferase-like isoleucine patch superfamily enzyme